MKNISYKKKIELDSEKGGVKNGGKNINNLRYVDDTILLAKGSSDLKHILINVKVESANPGLHFNIKKKKTMTTREIHDFNIGDEDIDIATILSNLFQ